MANRQAFGRRGQPLPRTTRQYAHAAPPAAASRIDVPVASEPIRRPELVRASSVDSELEDWKKQRRKNFIIPWRPLYIMASVTFGVASFVLPDSVNSDVNYLLYFLMAASFYAGIKKRRQKKAAAS